MLATIIEDKQSSKAGFSIDLRTQELMKSAAKL